MAKHTQVKAQNQNGNSLQLTQHETDSPVLPVAQLEQLQAFRPDLIDWVRDQTEMKLLPAERDNLVWIFLSLLNASQAWWPAQLFLALAWALLFFWL